MSWDKRNWPEYANIQEYYDGKFAKRSGVPYMQHIDEGLTILDRIGATEVAKRAYCLHPIFQEDSTLRANCVYAVTCSKKTLILVMEYRNIANRGLSCYQVDDPASIYLSPLKEVNDMLIADKVQNRKDFEIHHLGKHEKSIELDRYFRNWLRALDVTEAKYLELIRGL